MSDSTRHVMHDLSALDLSPLSARPIRYDLAGDAVMLHLGLPDPARLPEEALRWSMARALEVHGRSILQYAPESGMPILRERIAASEEGATEQVLVTHGVSEGIALLAAYFCGPGLRVLVETPTYPWALRVFQLHRSPIAFLPTDERGLQPEALEDALRAAQAAGERTVIYTMPNFHNPAGWSTAPERMEAVLGLAQKYHSIIIEDDCYRRLYAEGDTEPGCYRRLAAQTGGLERVVHLGSFSKLYGPGLRLGWLLADPALIEPLGKLKQTGTNHLMSATVAELIAQTEHAPDGPFVAESRATYRRRRDRMAEALEVEKLRERGVMLSIPGGGFYFWMHWEARRLAGQTAIDRLQERGILAMDGAICLPADTDRAAIRAAFSHVPEAQLTRAGEEIGRILREGLG